MAWIVLASLVAIVPFETAIAATSREAQASRLAVGFDHGCAVTPAGGVECWGDNSYGELGVSGVTHSATPVAAQLPVGWRAVAVEVGEHHTCALLADGGVGCWGLDFGQLGAGAGDQAPGPVRVQLPTHRSAIAISANSLGTCAILDDGTVVCWGWQNNGELGQATHGMHETPQSVPMPGGEAAVAISISLTHGCAVLDTGRVTCWGSNTNGQFGDGTTAPSTITGSASTPVLLDGGRRAVEVAAGQDFTCALSEVGGVNCWGRNIDGRLGDGTLIGRQTPTPIALGPTLRVVQVRVGTLHGCALVATGAVYCWGDNTAEQVGDGTTLQQESPVLAAVVSGSPVNSLEAGTDTTCALLDDGTLQCWGHITPATPHTFPTGTRVVQVAGGGNHTCALNSEGLVWCWGQNLYGQLGRGTVSLRELQPADPVTLPSPGRARAITAGTNHTCALLVDGRVSCWGQNSAGQLGVGVAGDRSTPSDPIALQGSGRAKAISAGGSHTCALHTDGTIACWGANVYGQLGDGGTTNQFATHDVVWMPGGSTAVAVTAGLDHTCALKADGAMVCWGRNGDGQLGDNTTSDRTSAVTVSVPPGTRAVAIDAGGFHTCALFGAGTVTCWGYNQWGQLGVDPTTTPQRSTPSGTLSLPGGHPTQAIELSVGDSHTCVLLDDGTAACWGYNGNGELGDGTRNTRFVPATTSAQPGGARIRMLSAGFTHHCAVLDDGSMSCWGQNFNGQLGTGDRVDQPTPTYAALPPGPTALTGVTASASVMLTWSESTTLYQPQTWTVEGSTDGTTWWAATVSAISPSGTTVSGLTNGVAYLFRVRSVTPLSTNTTQLSAYVTPVAAAPGTCDSASDAVFPVGDGSPENPYVVTSSAQLEVMRLPACLARHFEQRADIAIPDGTAWQRIGTVNTPFTGTYRGGGYVISNVSLGATAPGVGFFGALSGATVTDLTLENVVIVAAAGTPSSDGRAGALAGDVMGSTVSGVTVNHAQISGMGTALGGLIGRIRDHSAAPTYITHSSATATVSGGGAVGGLVGTISSSSSGHVTVSSSYSAGTVTGDQDVGGLVGYVVRTSTGTITVENSYATAAVDGLQLVAGGLVGGVNPLSAGGITLSRSYAVGAVSAPANTGGLVGHLYPNAPSWLVVDESFWDASTSGQTVSAGGVGLATVAMTSLRTFADANWSIVSGSSGVTTWGQCEGQYPVLMWQFRAGTPPCPATTPPAAPWSSDLTNQPTPSADDDDPAASAAGLPTAAQIARLPLRTLVDPASLRPGATVTFSVDGFVAGEPVMVLVASTPRLLDTVTTASNGVVRAKVTIPTDLGVGAHTLAVWAPQSQRGYRQRFTVAAAEVDTTVDEEVVATPSPQDALPSTGHDPRQVVLTALVLSVLGWTMMRRRRSGPAHHHSR